MVFNRVKMGREYRFGRINLVDVSLAPAWIKFALRDGKVPTTFAEKIAQEAHHCWSKMIAIRRLFRFIPEARETFILSNN